MADASTIISGEIFLGDKKHIRAEIFFCTKGHSVEVEDPFKDQPLPVAVSLRYTHTHCQLHTPIDLHFFSAKYISF